MDTSGPVGKSNLHSTADGLEAERERDGKNLGKTTITTRMAIFLQRLGRMALQESA